MGPGGMIYIPSFMMSGLVVQVTLSVITSFFMELSPSWEAANYVVILEFPSVLWNPEVHYRVHKIPPLVLILTRSIQSIPPHPISLRPILIVSTHLRLGLPSGSFLLAFPPMARMHSSSLHLCYIFCPSHPPWLDHSNYTWRRVKVMKLLIM
jgi:hypothetical protein